MHTEECTPNNVDINLPVVSKEKKERIYQKMVSEDEENISQPKVVPEKRYETFSQLDKIDDKDGWLKNKPKIKLERKSSIKVSI